MRRGCYALFLTVPDMKLDVGALGTVHFKEGEYCYIGSAMNGLDQRIARHMTKDKKQHWHIDRLTSAASDMEAFETESGDECRLAHIVGSFFMPAVKGFGCSDCRCTTHLFLVTGGKIAFTEAAGLYRHISHAHSV